MSLRKRLVNNGLASAGSIAWSALAQLISVPILTYVWGLERYGEWLMLITIPTYFALSDMGFTAAATSDMTMANARGDKNSVLATFQSVWVLVVLSSLTILVLASPLLLYSTDGGNAGSSWWQRHGSALFLLIVYSAAVLCSRVVLAGFRSTGNYALGTMIYDAIQFLEAGFALIAAYFGADFVVCASIYAATRALNFIVSYIVLVKFTPWLRIGVGYASFGEVKRLVSPAFAALAIPTALSINLQGTLLIAGYMIGPTAVALLGPVRTASRITIQIIGVVNRSSMPEFSSAAAKSDKNAISKIIAMNIRSVVFLLIPGALVFAILGGHFISMWSLGKIVPTTLFVSIISLSMLIHGVWYFASNLLVSTNEHGRFGRALLPASLLGMAMGLFLSRYFGLNGLALSLVFSELVALVILFPDFRRYIVMRG
jgi:O-antigen/teichoic acid export membrane protein